MCGEWQARVTPHEACRKYFLGASSSIRQSSRLQSGRLGVRVLPGVFVLSAENGTRCAVSFLKAEFPEGVGKTQNEFSS